MDFEFQSPMYLLITKILDRDHAYTRVCACVVDFLFIHFPKAYLQVTPGIKSWKELDSLTYPLHLPEARRG